jgi:hypothetical protein
MKITIKFCFVLFALSCLAATAQAQYIAAPFSVAPSNLINDLKAAKAANTKMTTEEFVNVANALLEKQGLNFVVAFDAATCRKISTAIADLKDKTAPLNLKTALKSPLGENANLLLPEVSFDQTECVPCFVRLPILQVAGKEFVTLVEGKNIKFFLPANFILNEAHLVDEKDLKTIKTSWKLPFRSAPLSVSPDGNILYLGLVEPELADLVLMAYSKEGVYQFARKSDLADAKKGVPVRDFPKDAANPNLAFLKFPGDAANQIVKFSSPCGN